MFSCAQPGAAVSAADLPPRPFVEDVHRPALDEAPRLPSTIPLKRDEAAVEGGWTDGARPWLLLFFVLAVVYFLRDWLWNAGKQPTFANGRLNAWSRLLGRAASSVTPTDLHVLTSRRLTSSHSIHVISWQGSRLLIGCSEGGIAVLSREPAQGTDAAAVAGSGEAGSQ